MMLEASNLTLRAGTSIFPVWRVDLEIGRSERIAVVGESGGGKTSLAWALTGRPLPGQTVFAGDVSFRGTSLLGLSPKDRSSLYYRRMALVPQNSQETFHPAQPMWKSAREVASRGVEIRMDRTTVLDMLESSSRSLGLEPKLWSHFPHQLSGGQKQRMALILALLNRPNVLLLDEPTNALDELTLETMIACLDRWITTNHAGAVLFTHDIGMAMRWAERMVVLYRGEIVEELPAQMTDAPLHPYTKGLMSSRVRLGDTPLSRQSIPGHALPLTRPPKGCGFFERCPGAVKMCRLERPPLQSRGDHKVRCSMELDFPRIELKDSSPCWRF
jgi:oligopeptide/dipeptide ABC transporter ATP-binding protein